MSLADPTSGLISQAGQYMNSSPVQSAINSTNAQLQQQLHEQTVPGLNRQAAMGGALNSSRAGMAEAMANEGEGIAQGNADASILNNAYNTGMGTAAGLYSNGLNTANSANMGGIQGALGTTGQQIGINQFNTGAQLNAANSGLSQQLGFGLGNANTQLAANGQLGTGVGMGFNGATTAGNLAAGNFALGSGGGMLQQAGDQATLNNAYQVNQNFRNQPWQALQNYWGIAGQPLGSQSAGTGSMAQQLPPNYAGNALGGAAAGAGLYQSGLFGNNTSALSDTQMNNLGLGPNADLSQFLV